MRNTSIVHRSSKENQCQSPALLVAVLWSPRVPCEGRKKTKLFSIHRLPFRRTWKSWTDCLAPVWSFFYFIFIHTGVSVRPLTGNSAQFCAQRNSKTGLSLLGKEGWNESTWKEHPVIKESFSFTLYLFQSHAYRSNRYCFTCLGDRTAAAFKNGLKSHLILLKYPLKLCLNLICSFL